VAHACNPSYLEGSVREDHGLKASPGKKFIRSHFDKFLKNLKVELPYDLTIPLLGSQSAYNRDTYTHVYCPTIHGSQDKELA
jgi:hypothetical protein